MLEPFDGKVSVGDQFDVVSLLLQEATCQSLVHHVVLGQQDVQATPPFPQGVSRHQIRRRCAADQLQGGT